MNKPSAKKLWAFLSVPQNLAIIVAFGGACGFLWEKVISPKAMPPVAISPAAASAAPVAPAVVQVAKTDSGRSENTNIQSSAGMGGTVNQTAESKNGGISKNTNGVNAQATVNTNPKP